MLKVTELIRVINHDFSTKGRRKRIPAGFCYVCNQLDPRGRGGGRGGNPYRHLVAKGLLKACPHLPPAPHPTFVSLNEDDDGNYEDDGFDEESFDLGDAGSQDGGMFDTAIVREDEDPTLFTLPPVFGGSGQQQQEKKKRKNKNGPLVPMVSENTFLTTNRRGQGHDPDLLDETAAAADGEVVAGARIDRKAGDLRLPRLTDQRASLVAEGKGRGQGAGQGQGRRKEKDPRRLHSERIDRRPANGGEVDRFTRSDSAIGLERTDTEMTREKTDPPPQPIVVSIKDQDGTVLRKLPLENLPPGLDIPTEAFVTTSDQQQQKGRKQRARKQRRDDDRNRYGGVSPAFSGSISISRETTLSGYESPDFEFMSRLRSASWCECPDHARHAEVASRASGGSGSSGSCPECRKSRGQHEKWCVSRNSVCQRCGKAFKRKYPHLERKTSFGTIAAGGSGAAAARGGAHSPTASSSAATGSVSRGHHRRHQNCSPTKSLSESQHNHRATGDVIPEVSSTGNNRVRFQEEGSVVYPQWESFAQSEDDKGADGVNKDSALQAGEGNEFEKTRMVRRIHFRNAFDADIHRRAYDLALADAKTKQLFQPAKKKKQAKVRLLDAPKGIYFSYFPRLKRRKPEAISSGGDEEGGRAGSPKSIGVRADSREGKQLKVKKGLKHVLGSTKLEDYYPGGKCYPR